MNAIAQQQHDTSNVTLIHARHLPPPLIDANIDLRGLPWMKLDITRLRKSRSWLSCRARPEIGFYMLNLWMAAWHEVPAGSLEDDDAVLAWAAMCDPAHWPAVKDQVLQGWIKASDARLYHPTVVALAQEAWASSQKRRLEGAERARRHRERVKAEATGNPAAPENASEDETCNALRDVTAHESPTCNALHNAVSGGRLETVDSEKKEKNYPPTPRKTGGEMAAKADLSAQSAGSAESADGAERPRIFLTPPPVPPPPTSRHARRAGALAIGLADPLFVRFWSEYPRKVGQGAAALAWVEAVRWVKSQGGEVEDIFSGLVGQKHAGAFDMRERGRFCPHPSTWLNQQRWNDRAVEGEG